MNTQLITKRKNYKSNLGDPYSHYYKKQKGKEHGIQWGEDMGNDYYNWMNSWYYDKINGVEIHHREDSYCYKYHIDDQEICIESGTPQL